MKAEIKDKDKNIVKALNMLGFKVNSNNVELILNVVDFVQINGSNTTIKDLSELEQLVNDLFKA